MAGLVPAIHDFDSRLKNSWMPGTRPGMTNSLQVVSLSAIG